MRIRGLCKLPDGRGSLQMWELDHKEDWVPKNWCFQTVVLRRLLRVPWITRRSNQSILKEINLEYSLEGLILKLKLQYFGHMIRRANSGRDSVARKVWGQEEKGVTEDEMVGLYYWLNGHELEQTLGDREGQGSLVCCSAWGHKESDMTELLNWTEQLSVVIM